MMWSVGCPLHNENKAGNCCGVAGVIFYKTGNSSSGSNEWNRYIDLLPTTRKLILQLSLWKWRCLFKKQRACDTDRRDIRRTQEHRSQQQLWANDSYDVVVMCSICDMWYGERSLSVSALQRSIKSLSFIPWGLESKQHLREQMGIANARQTEVFVAVVAIPAVRDMGAVVVPLKMHLGKRLPH